MANVIIVGAGFAGLSTAYHLLEGGSKVDQIIIIEARDRIGGRIYTVTKQVGPHEVHLDLGASWIHGVQGNPIMGLCSKYKVRTHKGTGEEYVFHEDGSTYPIKPSGELDDELMELFWDLSEEVEKHEKEDIPFKEALEKYGKSRLDKIFQKKKKMFDSKRERFDEFVQLILRGYEGYNGEIVEKVSGKLDCFIDYPGGDRFVADGYSKVIQGLAEDLKASGKVKILTEHVVKSIKADEKKVSVSGENFEYSGDRVVVTVPLGVLKASAISFSPKLPDNKLEVINRMGFGILNKVVLIFKKQFWPKDVEWLAHISKTKYSWILNLTYEADVRVPVLVAFSTRTASIIESMEEKEAIEDLLATLEKHFGNKVREFFIEGMVSKWLHDPFALGAYSYLALGSKIEDFATLAEPVFDGLIGFAGEATMKEHYGCTHSAFLSGKREAERILQSLK